MKNYMNYYEGGISEYANAEKDYPNVSLIEGAQGVAYSNGGDNPYFMDEKALKEFTDYNNAEEHEGLELNWYDTFTQDGGGAKAPVPTYNGGDATAKLGAKNAYVIADALYNDWGEWQLNVTLDDSDEGLFTNVYDDKGSYVLEIRRTQDSGAKAPVSDLLFEITSDGESEWGYTTYTEGVFAFSLIVPDKDENAE